jgi:hypothetical protein
MSHKYFCDVAGHWFGCKGSHYGDKAEKTRGEIIEKTLREMCMLSLSEQDPQSIDFLSGVITQHQRRLPPDTKIKTCGAFKYLNAGCCDPCHASHSHYEMDLIELPDGGKAWVCHGIEWAIYPEPYAELKEWSRNTPKGMVWREICCDDDRPKN